MINVCEKVPSGATLAGWKLLNKKAPGVRHQNVFTHQASISRDYEDSSSQLIRSWCSNTYYDVYFGKKLCWKNRRQKVFAGR